MENDNKADQTIRNYDKLLSYLAKHTDLSQPEEVKRFVASKANGNAYKRNLIIAYALYCKHYHIEWQKPLYRQEAKHIRIPTREKLGKFISNAGMTLSIKLQISMETGLRPIELHNLKAKDVDLQQRIIYPTTAKYGASRSLRMSPNLTERLGEYLARTHLKPEDTLFRGTPQRYGNHYRKLRNRLAEKLKDASLKTVRLYDFRHYFATNLYDKTKDILLVKQQMGHKKLDTTLIYTQLLNLNEDEWTCKGATTVEQATQLIEAGFQYVTEIDEVKLFRKRK
jgi:integrase/recombinase XerD